jgi:hypothetical protein
MTKTLYFEGAGCVPRGEVENCRIRTAFHNDKGEAIYLELIGVEVTKKSVKSIQKYENAGFVDSCFYIRGDDDDNNHTIHHRNSKTFEYSKQGILNIVNSLECSFDSVVILPSLAGYRVHGNNRGYNFGDEFKFNAERTERAEVIRQHFYDIEKNEGKQFPNLSLWVDDENVEILHLFRHFNGYNRHWVIKNVEDWAGTVEEIVLGRYGC